MIQLRRFAPLNKTVGAVSTKGALNACVSLHSDLFFIAYIYKDDLFIFYYIKTLFRK